MKVTHKEENNTAINFESKLLKIGDWTIFTLPKSASAQIPSRGMAVIEGTINGFPFKSAVEPDGIGGHWVRFTQAMSSATKAKTGDAVKITSTLSSEWLEPEVPDDLEKMLTDNPQAKALWEDITPNARWDWVRWVRSTKIADTRKKRIEKACSKLKSGMRRPCCFNRSMCSIAEVSKNWILRDHL